MTLNITGLTVTLELKRSTYGADGPVSDRFVSLKAEVPTPADGVSLEDALARSLEMHLTAWESLYAAELAAGSITQDVFNEKRGRLRKRTAKLIAFMKEPTNE